MASDLAALLDPGYLGDLTGRAMDEVRAMRTECQEVETGLSLLRRVVQGRLDIVGVELQRRAAEGGDPADLPDLIARLPEVLSDRTHAPGRRSPAADDGARASCRRSSRRSSTPSSAPVTWPTSRRSTTTTCARWPTQLAAFEQKVSGHRHDLFERIDALQAEITRRYKTGEASVDSLLQ